MRITLRKLKSGEISADVHKHQETYGADIVSMITSNPSSCGAGYVGPRKGTMFSVTEYSCATGNYSFGHEVGHNLGLTHDRGTKNACIDDGRIGYGWRDPKAAFRTIMAYNCQKGQCDNNKGGGCAIIPRFSAPSLLHNGKAIGSPNVNSARAINDVRATVAGYYPHVSDETEMPAFAPTTEPTAEPTAEPTKAQHITLMLKVFVGNFNFLIVVHWKQIKCDWI